MKRVLADSGCTDGDCPAIWQDDASGVVTVRGYDPASSTVEREVTIPREVWEHLVGQLPR